MAVQAEAMHSDLNNNGEIMVVLRSLEIIVKTFNALSLLVLSI